MPEFKRPTEPIVIYECDPRPPCVPRIPRGAALVTHLAPRSPGATPPHASLRRSGRRYDGSPFCRKVREACSLLALTVEYRRARARATASRRNSRSLRVARARAARARARAAAPAARRRCAAAGSDAAVGGVSERGARGAGWGRPRAGR